MFLGKLPVCFQTVRTDTQHLGVQAFEALQLLLESLQFACSDRGKVCKVEGQDHVFLPEKILKSYLPLC
jgi:hypothetical protein